MTLLGKIFLSFITVLSIAFMVMSITVTMTHRNWREVVLGPNGLKAQVEEKERVITQLQAEVQDVRNNLNLEQAARRTALAALQSRTDQYRNELAAVQSRVEKLQGENSSLAAEDLQRAEELARLSQDNTNLRNQILMERQERDQLFVRATEVNDQLNRYRGEFDNLSERNQQLLAQVTRYQEVIDKLGVNPNDPLDGAPPNVNGEVLVVRQPSNEVEISIGYDEGIRKGHFLDVTRKGTYLGKVRVTRTDSGRAVAEILKPYSNGTIQRGDRVDTTLD